MNRFQRIALTAFVCLEALIFVGAIVRATGSGLGIPDWPLCYGRTVPPTSADQIDFGKLDLAKFKAAAARHGRDPASITVESLRAGFDPVATWIEYLNRLTSLPLALSVLAMLVASFWQRQRTVLFASIAAMVLLLLNAWIGATVVLSALQPVRITLHVALAILMQAVLIYIAWRGTERPWRLPLNDRRVVKLAWLLLGLVVLEGMMGTQIRQLTDHLAQHSAALSRADWTGQLEQSFVYLAHRSFSWFILGTAILFYRMASQSLPRIGWLEQGVLGLVFAQMLLGVVLSQVGIVRVAQILHIGLSSLLVSGLCLWLLGTTRTNALVR